MTEELLIQIGAIYLAGITGLYKGVPVGIAMNAHPFITAGFTALGSITAILVIFFSGEKLKSWISRKIGENKLEKRKKKFIYWMDKYGTIGLGLIVTGLIGPIVTVLLGMAMVRDTRRLIIFMVIGIIIWSAGLTAMGILSVDIVKSVF